MYKKSLQINEYSPDEDPEDVLLSCHDLTELYKNMEDYEKVLAFSLKEYKIVCSKPKLKDVIGKKIYENLKVAYSRCNPQGDFKQWLDEDLGCKPLEDRLGCSQ